MLPKTIFLTALLVAAAEGQPSEGHTLNGLSSPHESKITWTGRIEEGGNLMSFTGRSLQDIEGQIRDLNPDFSWSGAAEPGRSSAESGVLCDMAWNPRYASVFHIRQGISYLRKIRGDCAGGPGPGNCSRVSCSYRSGIWFCNDNPNPVSVPCSTFGDRAWDIIEKCYAFGNNPTDSVHGQVFDTDGWNVIVAGADC